MKWTDLTGEDQAALLKAAIDGLDMSIKATAKEMPTKAHDMRLILKDTVSIHASYRRLKFAREILLTMQR